jgi:hypothetical protein
MARTRWQKKSMTKTFPGFQTVGADPPLTGCKANNGADALVKIEPVRE